MQNKLLMLSLNNVVIQRVKEKTSCRGEDEPSGLKCLTKELTWEDEMKHLCLLGKKEPMTQTSKKRHNRRAEGKETEKLSKSKSYCCEYSSIKCIEGIWRS